MKETSTAAKDLERLVGELRAKLHRYCAPMTGSVVDGEDVVQEALVHALDALSKVAEIAGPGADPETLFESQMAGSRPQRTEPNGACSTVRR